MNLLFVLSVALFAAGFAYVAAGNFDFAVGEFKAEPGIAIHPPYYFNPQEISSQFNAFFFVFLFSLLFFGLSAPVALAIEGAKYGTMLSSAAPNAFDFAFAIPQVLAAYSAILLGQGVFNDFGSEKSVFDAWSVALKYFIAGLALTAALAATK
ncbi:MAG: hypothetical protein V1708_00880, partial [Candidatus Micrarchaeota archaeon]